MHPALTGNHGFVGIEKLRVHPGQSHVQVRQVDHRCCYLFRPISDAHRGQQAVVYKARSCLRGSQAAAGQQWGENNKSSDNKKRKTTTTTTTTAAAAAATTTTTTTTTKITTKTTSS